MTQRENPQSREGIDASTMKKSDPCIQNGIKLRRWHKERQRNQASKISALRVGAETPGLGDSRLEKKSMQKQDRDFPHYLTNNGGGSPRLGSGNKIKGGGTGRKNPGKGEPVLKATQAIAGIATIQTTTRGGKIAPIHVQQTTCNCRSRLRYLVSYR